jgi:hypothetical protein
MSGIPVAFEFGRVVFRAVSLNWPGSVRAHPDGRARTEERSERTASERASIFVSGEGWCADAKAAAVPCQFIPRSWYVEWDWVPQPHVLAEMLSNTFQTLAGEPSPHFSCASDEDGFCAFHHKIIRRESPTPVTEPRRRRSTPRWPRRREKEHDNDGFASLPCTSGSI